MSKFTKPSGAVFNEAGQAIGGVTSPDGGNTLVFDCDPPLDSGADWFYGIGLIFGDKYRQSHVPVGDYLEFDCLQWDIGHHCLRWEWYLRDENGGLIARGSIV